MVFVGIDDASLKAVINLESLIKAMTIAYSEQELFLLLSLRNSNTDCYILFHICIHLKYVSLRYSISHQ